MELSELEVGTIVHIDPDYIEDLSTYLTIKGFDGTCAQLTSEHGGNLLLRRWSPVKKTDKGVSLIL